MADKFTYSITIRREDIPPKLIDDLKKFSGLPPYDGGGNIVAGDGYFIRSIEARFGESMVAAANALVIEPMQREWEAAKAEVARKFR